MKALILAGGFGVRLRELVHGQPKHMVAINGRPFLRRLVTMLIKRGINEIVFAVGYLPQSIKDEFKEYCFSEDDRPMGTAGSLKNAQRFFKSDFLMINGDTYLDIDYQQVFRDHQTSGLLATLVVNQEVSCGVYVFSPQVFNLIPEGTKYSLEKDLWPIFLKQKQVNLFKTNQKFIDIGSPEGYAKALKELK
jgi:NDP-sugar pyrophosphorylase family protein